MELNIAENRNHLNYSKWIYVKRILWTFGKFFFRNSPRIAFGYRPSGGTSRNRKDFEGVA